jgi:predicted amidohydrolase
MLLSSKFPLCDSNGAQSVSIRVAIAQINPKLGDLEANFSLYDEKVRQGMKERADFLLFPELSLTGYYLRDTVPSLALTLKSAEITRLKQLSRQLPFVAGLVEESADNWTLTRILFGTRSLHSTLSF